MSRSYFTEALTEAPILGYPDMTKAYLLYTDASHYNVGGILTQDRPVGEKVICYVTHHIYIRRIRLTYDFIYNKEMLEIVYIRRIRLTYDLIQQGNFGN